MNNFKTIVIIASCIFILLFSSLFCFKESILMAQMLDSVKFEEPGYGYSIKYPSDWIYEKKGNATIIFSGLKGTDSYFSTVNVQKLFSNKFEEGSYDSVMSVINDLKNQLINGAVDTKIFDEKDYNYSDSIKGREFTTEYSRYDEKFKQWVVVVPGKNNDFYFLWSYTCPIHLYNEYYMTAKAMLKSWKLD
ncbi:MAG: hypothetical protein AB1782_01095 [Cyanobacteriota bacterium]